MSEAIVRIKRHCVVNVLGMQAAYETGQIVGMRQTQADIMVGLGDAEYYNKMESGPSETKTMEVVVEVNKDAADFAEEHGIDLTLVQGTGKEGRITLKDVKAFAKASGE